MVRRALGRACRRCSARFDPAVDPDAAGFPPFPHQAVILSRFGAKHTIQRMNCLALDRLANLVSEVVMNVEINRARRAESVANRLSSLELQTALGGALVPHLNCKPTKTAVGGKGRCVPKRGKQN